MSYDINNIKAPQNEQSKALSVATSKQESVITAKGTDSDQYSEYSLSDSEESDDIEFEYRINFNSEKIIQQRVKNLPDGTVVNKNGYVYSTIYGSSSGTRVEIYPNNKLKIRKICIDKNGHLVQQMSDASIFDVPENERDAVMQAQKELQEYLDECKKCNDVFEVYNGNIHSFKR